MGKISWMSYGKKDGERCLRRVWNLGGSLPVVLGKSYFLRFNT